MVIEIEKTALEKACMEIIETILFCLPNAFKGTIYRIGKPPELIVERITSGIIDAQRETISWGLPAQSEYNAPGKSWIEYRDQPERPLEAMAWCVERQKSWTSEDPARDVRNIRFQVDGKQEDFHHMEPVLLRKSDLKSNRHATFTFPEDYYGNTIWGNSDYIVVAVIKIHFLPFTIKIGSHETRVIKKLSRSLGTELLSYQLQHESLRVMEQLAADRLHACNLLADSLRNSITKSGLIFSLVKQEIGHLRDRWEEMLSEGRNEKNRKVTVIQSLNEMALSIDNGCQSLTEKLISIQNSFLNLSLPPEKGENWVARQIEERWKEVLDKSPQDDYKKKAIWEKISELKTSLYFGRNSDIIASCERIPDEIKAEWVALLYGPDESYNKSSLERIITLLGNPFLAIPSQEKSRKTLTRLKALADTMNQLEQDTNFLLNKVLNGKNNGPASTDVKNPSPVLQPLYRSS